MSLEVESVKAISLLGSASHRDAGGSKIDLASSVLSGEMTS